MPEIEKVMEIVRQAARSDIRLVEQTTPPTVAIAPDDLRRVCQVLHTHPELYFDMLSCVTGLDNGPAMNTCEVLYHLYSIPYHFSLALKVTLPRENPVIDSVVSVWRGADWLEREVYDMFGITFTHHPDLRRILMPADWQGFPLRKDYQHQDEYHGVTVAYDLPENKSSSENSH